MSGKNFAVGVLIGGIAGALTGIVIAKCCEEKKWDCSGIGDDNASDEEIESDEETTESDNDDKNEGAEDE